MLTCRAAEEHRVLGESELARTATIARLSTVWADVFTRMENDPTGPLATAFSAPLALWLAKHTYADGAVEPARRFAVLNAVAAMVFCVPLLAWHWHHQALADSWSALPSRLSCRAAAIHCRYGSASGIR